MKPRSERRKMPQPPSEVVDMALPTSADAIEAFNKRAYKEYEEKTLMTCPHCSRTFKSALALSLMLVMSTHRVSPGSNYVSAYAALERMVHMGCFGVAEFFREEGLQVCIGIPS